MIEGRGLWSNDTGPARFLKEIKPAQIVTYDYGKMHNDTAGYIVGGWTGADWDEVGNTVLKLEWASPIVCTEDWLADSNPCVNGTQLISYTDQNACGTYDYLPANNGTYVACGVQPYEPAHTSSDIPAVVVDSIVEFGAELLRIMPVVVIVILAISLINLLRKVRL